MVIHLQPFSLFFCNNFCSKIKNDTQGVKINHKMIPDSNILNNKKSTNGERHSK